MELEALYKQQQSAVSFYSFLSVQGSRFKVQGGSGDAEHWTLNLKNLSESFDAAQDERRSFDTIEDFRSAEPDEAW